MARDRGDARPTGGFTAVPADGGLSIDRLARAFAAMMGGPDPRPDAAQELVEVDVSPDLDPGGSGDAAVRVSPLTILEALLFVGAGGRPLASRSVAALIRGVSPREIDELATALGKRYRAENRPYEVVSQDAGWILRLRPEFARYGNVLEGRARLVRLDADALDVLALVAWSQPVPRDRLVELGCDASPAVLRQLVRRGLLAVEQGPAGEPTYRTTPRFLEVFKLQSLADLPNPTDPPQ